MRTRRSRSPRSENSTIVTVPVSESSPLASADFSFSSGNQNTPATDAEATRNALREIPMEGESPMEGHLRVHPNLHRPPVFRGWTEPPLFERPNGADVELRINRTKNPDNLRGAILLEDNIEHDRAVGETCSGRRIRYGDRVDGSGWRDARTDSRSHVVRDQLVERLVA